VADIRFIMRSKEPHFHDLPQEAALYTFLYFCSALEATESVNADRAGARALVKRPYCGRGAQTCQETAP
jgi:hypothetical protein